LPEGSRYLIETSTVRRVGEILRSATTNAPARLLLQGERGVGKKTAVDRALASRAATGEIVILQANADETRSIYAPLANAFDDLLSRQKRNDDLRNLVVDAVGDILRLVPFFNTLGGRVRELHSILVSAQTQPATTTPDLLFRVQRVLRSLLRKSHVVVVFADIQHYDTTTLSIVSQLIRNDDLRCSYILTQDTSHVLTGDFAQLVEDLVVALPLVQRFTLVQAEPFSAPETTQFVRMYLQNARLDAADGLAFQDRTNGNAQFLLELLEHLNREQQIVWHAAGHGTLLPEYRDATLPTSIRKLIDLRLSRLTPELQRVLNVASVIGVEFQHEPISGSLRLDELEVLERLNILRRVHNLVTQLLHSGHRFTLAAIRDAVYDNLGRDMARVHHQLIARYFEQHRATDDDDDVIAFHFERAGLFHDALRYATSAAEAARRRNAPAEAARRFQHAYAINMHIAPLDITEATGLLEKQATALYEAGDFGAAADAFRMLLDEITEPARRVECILHLGATQYMLDQPKIAFATLEPLARASFELLSRASQVRLRLILSGILFHTGRFADGREQYKLALALRSRHDAPERRHELVKRINMFFLPEIALPQLLATREQMADATDTVLYWEVNHNIGCNYMLSGDLDTARALFAESYRYFDDIGTFRAAHSLNNLGLVDLVRGRFETARSHFALSRVAAATVFERLSANVHLAVIDALTGNVESAVTTLERLRHTAYQTTEMVLHEIVTHNLAWAYGLVGRAPEAIHIFEEEVPRRGDLWYSFRQKTRDALVDELKAHGRLAIEDTMPFASGIAGAWWFRGVPYELNDIWFWE
jgi:tetratricopeptide (TPR) repeat protein